MSKQLCSNHEDPCIWFSFVSQANQLPAITLFERATPCSIYHICGVYTNQISRNLMNSVDSSKNILFFFESKHFKMANFMLGGANTSQCEMSQMVVTISPPKIMNIGQTLWFWILHGWMCSTLIQYTVGGPVPVLSDWYHQDWAISNLASSCVHCFGVASHANQFSSILS